ncbi:MAG: HAMP domain-containing sensor histidine kinase [Dehalococcoidia bacterium]
MTQIARLRLTAGYALVWLLMILALCAVAYVAMSRSLDAEVDAGIRSVVDTWSAGAPPLGSLRATDVEREFEGENAGVFLLVFRVDGSLVANPSRVHVEDLFEHAGLGNVIARGGWATLRAEHQDLRVFARPLLQDGVAAGVVVGGRSLAEHDRQVATLATILAVSGALGLVLGVGGGYFLAGRALEPLERAQERQRAFIADASHELRAPLAVIRTSTDLLLRDAPTPKQRQALEDVQAVTDEAASLVQDLLVLARLDRPRRQSEERCRLDLVAADVIENLRPLLVDHASAVTSRLDPVTARLGDAEARRMLRALLENAVRHTPIGTAIDVETALRDGRVRMLIRDRGAGVPSSELEHIFERFAQVETARTPGAGAGAGLGLAIVRAISRSVGGDARARNVEGGGFEVEVTLPRA